MNWNDVNVLRKLSDGWHSVPSNSRYGKMISKNPDIKHNDSVERAKKRHEDVLRKEREIDDFVKMTRLRDDPDTCVHRNFSHKGYFICAKCGLAKRGLSESDEVTNRVCDKARGILKKIIDDLDIDEDIDSDDILKVYKTYVLTDNDRGNRNFRISARPEGLCAALLWRELQIMKVPMTMLEFSRRIRVDRTSVYCVFKRLDDYKDFKISKRGRPRRK